MDAFEPGGYVVCACCRRHETNQAILACVAAFHSNLTGAHRPAIIRTPLRLPGGVVCHVGIPPWARSAADARMPEAYRTRWISILVESKFSRIKRVCGGVAILPHLVRVISKREIGGQVEY